MMPEIFGISTYGIMCAIGLAAASVFVVLRAERLDGSIVSVVRYIVFAVAGLIVGSKLVFFVSRLPHLAEIHASCKVYVEEFVEAGYVFYGGVLGAYAGLLICCRLFGAAVRPVLNFFTPAFALFHGFGRIGCFCVGCCYGIEVERLGFVMDGVRRFPIQLLESVFEFLMFFMLLFIGKRTEQKKKSPKLSFYYLMVYSIVRFNLEFLRGDEIRGFFGPLSTSQWIALMILTAGMIGRFVVRLRMRQKDHPDAASAK
ncbi:MAG: prolipoprotein diacylglyceryl transferase [Lachnospiraceae bacterium]|nr:prolipoprotein diacylglyceryl transferase [Lachnospiraceae bacterium]